MQRQFRCGGGLSGLMIVPLITVACSRIGFAPSQTDLGSLSVENVGLTTTTVNTKKNQSVTFTISGTTQGSKVGLLSFSPNPGQLNLTTPNGRYQITDPVGFDLTFTPNQGFVGVDNATVQATDVYGNSLNGLIIVNVGNILNSIQPALAVRGISCITCHSSVQSNIITDYGFGNPWYFDTTSNDSFYFDRLNSGSNQNGLATLSLTSNSQIIVPAAQVPPAIQAQFNVTSLSDFIKARFAQGSPNSAAQVKEVGSLTIRIPTASRIQQLFGRPAAASVYLPDTQASPPIQGLNFDAVNNVFVISSLTCDGDLYLGAPVLFENATVTSIAGCRIYATASIFVDGPLVSAPFAGSTAFNTQLLSSESIWVGAGRINNDSGFCEVDSNNNPTGWYSLVNNTGVDCTNATKNGDNPRCDTLTFRMASFMDRNTFSRAYPDANSLQQFMSSPDYGGNPGALLSERAQIETSLGHVLYDSSCGQGGRNVAMSRLMLVAPYVSDRYTGSFSGSTVAEAALMSLGKFSFQFDPVFSGVSVFSLLDDDELISGEDL